MPEAKCQKCGTPANLDQLGEPCPTCSFGGNWSGLVVEVEQTARETSIFDCPDRSEQVNLEREVVRLRRMVHAGLTVSAQPWKMDQSPEGHYDQGRMFVHLKMVEALRLFLNEEFGFHPEDN